jgi:O-antigen ligase
MLVQSRFARGFSVAALFLITLGFFVYQTGVRNELIPPFLGGYVAIVTITLAPFALIAYILSFDRNSNRFTLADTLLLSMAVLIAAVAFSYFDQFGPVKLIAESHLFIAIQFFTLFVAFRFVPFESQIFKKWLLAAVAISSLAIINANLGDVRMYAQLQNEDVADYQQYAVYYSILLFFSLIALGNGKARFLLYVVGAIVLFVNGARSEFIGWVFAVAVIEGLRTRQFMILAAIGLFLVLPFVGAGTGLLQTYFPDNRISALIENFSQDQSYLERQDTIDQALATISDRPLTGDYARYEPGRYAHNVLSLWQDFGFFGFAIFCCALLAALVRCILNFRKRAVDEEFTVFFAILLMSILLFAVAKAFGSPLFPLAMALYARHLTRSQPVRLPGSSPIVVQPGSAAHRPTGYGG